MFGAELSMTVLGPGFPPCLPTSACSYIVKERGYCAMKSSPLIHLWGRNLQDFIVPSSLPSLEEQSQGSHLNVYCLVRTLSWTFRLGDAHHCSMETGWTLWISVYSSLRQDIRPNHLHSPCIR